MPRCGCPPVADRPRAVFRRFGFHPARVFCLLLAVAAPAESFAKSVLQPAPDLGIARSLPGLAESRHDGFKHHRDARPTLAIPFLERRARELRRFDRFQQPARRRERSRLSGQTEIPAVQGFEQLSNLWISITVLLDHLSSQNNRIPHDRIHRVLVNGGDKVSWGKIFARDSRKRFPSGASCAAPLLARPPPGTDTTTRRPGDWP